MPERNRMDDLRKTGVVDDIRRVMEDVRRGVTPDEAGSGSNASSRGGIGIDDIRRVVMEEMRRAQEMEKQGK